jgi:hypothetical protein
MKTLLFVLMVLFLASTVQAQGTQTKDQAYWYVSSYKVAWSKVDSLKTLVKMYTGAMIAQAKKMGRILDYRLLTHHTGGEYNVIIMVKYPSWEAMGKGAGFGEAYKAIEPDAAKRKAVWDTFNWVFENPVHVDNIYTEATDQ